jgi:hypothetical protein
MPRRLDRFKKLLVFQKSEELMELANVIAETLKEDDKKEHLAAEILTNACLFR